MVRSDVRVRCRVRDSSRFRTPWSKLLSRSRAWCGPCNSCTVEAFPFAARFFVVLQDEASDPVERYWGTDSCVEAIWNSRDADAPKDDNTQRLYISSARVERKTAPSASSFSSNNLPTSSSTKAGRSRLLFLHQSSNHNSNFSTKTHTNRKNVHSQVRILPFSSIPSRAQVLLITAQHQRRQHHHGPLQQHQRPGLQQRHRLGRPSPRRQALRGQPQGSPAGLAPASASVLGQPCPACR